MFFSCEEGCCRLAPNAVNSKATVMSARNEVRVGADELDFRGEFFPSIVKNPWKASTVRSLPTQSKRVAPASI